MNVSYLEIYKEELRDILWSRGGMAGVGPRDLHIREDERGNTGRKSLQLHDITSALGSKNYSRIP